MAVMRVRRSGRLVGGIVALLVCVTALWMLNKALSAPERRARFRAALGGPAAVPIFVQDEHQDALPRWYEFAAAEGIADISLVHIDAHSDMAIPGTYTRDAGTRLLPPFTRDAIRTSNDEFIEDSVHSRLVGRITWIIPDWGVENEGGMFENQWNNGYVHPERAAITVGFSKKDGGAPCDCVMLGPWRNHEDSASKWCSSAGDDDLDSADCALTNKVPLEAMVGSRVLRRGITIRDIDAADDSPVNVILDIDEDYFVTTNPMFSLAAAGWTNHSLGMLDDVLMRICAHDSASEQWLAERIVEATLGHTITIDPAVDADKYICPVGMLDLLDREVPLGQQLSFEATLQAYVHDLNRVTEKYSAEKRRALLDALVDVGFGITPRSERGAHNEFPAQMCVTTGVDQSRGSDEGEYVPNNLVMFHVPTDAQLERELTRMREYLISSGIGPHVRLVTLVRSLRDGYLPKRLWHKIESHVLETLGLLLPNSYVVMDGRPVW